MLTLKLITEETERVIAGLEKKHFTGARQSIEEVIAVDKSRRAAQTELDQNLSNAKKLAAEIGMLMKQGKREEAEEVKTKVAALKETSKDLENKKETAEQELTRLLCQIPNIPYDEVPEGTCAEDNWVVKSNLKECVLGKDTVGNWDANPVVETAKLPHWELAKKYNLIDFDLGVKISGAGFPVYRGKGARLQRALIDFFLDDDLNIFEDLLEFFNAGLDVSLLILCCIVFSILRQIALLSRFFDLLCDFLTAHNLQLMQFILISLEAFVSQDIFLFFHDFLPRFPICTKSINDMNQMAG